jgi:hypothetical protein
LHRTASLHADDPHPLCLQKSCLLITLFNIDQICARLPLFTLSSLTCHRFVITSITVASKGLCDAFCPNNLYARVGGIPVTELNVLEREFLSMIDWRLMVSTWFPSFFFASSSLHLSGASLSIWSFYTFLTRFFCLCFFFPPSRQCTREILQEYYVNLVRTHSGGKFYIAGEESPSVSSDSEIDMDSGGSSPTDTPTPAQPSAVLLEPGTTAQEVVQRPTIEQNMAFAALQLQHLQQSQELAQLQRDRP